MNVFILIAILCFLFCDLIVPREALSWSAVVAIATYLGTIIGTSTVAVIAAYAVAIVFVGTIMGVVSQAVGIVLGSIVDRRSSTLLIEIYWLTIQKTKCSLPWEMLAIRSKVRL